MRRVRFGPDRLSLLPVVVLVFGTIPLAASSRWLVWLMLVPLAAAWWVLRARVVVDDEGLRVSNGLGSRRYAWDTVEGFDVPRRGPVRLLLRGSRRVVLTALPRRQLRRLLELAPSASGAGPSAGSDAAGQA